MSRAEELLEARAILPGDGPATELSVSSARRSSVTEVCLSQSGESQPSLSSPSCLSLWQVM